MRHPSVDRDREGMTVPELAEPWKLSIDITGQLKLRLGLPVRQVDLAATRDRLEWSPHTD